MAACPVPLFPMKKPPAWQLNWITGRYEAPPEQLELDLPPVEAEGIEHEGVHLLSTENGSQLVVGGFGLFLGKKSERVVVKQGGKALVQLPFLKLQEIVVASRGVSISSDLIEELCGRGIRIAFNTGAGKPYALLTSPLLSATVETRRAQLRAYDEPLGAQFCRWVVAGKLRNQEKLIRYFARSRDGDRRKRLETAASQLRRLRTQSMAVAGDSAAAVRQPLLGYEGTGGRIYWSVIADIVPEPAGFRGRDPHSPGDGVNAALNYGYGILYSHVWGAVMNAGLEPFAGFLHTDRSGKPSLVLDLVEEFRQPVVDRALFTWLTKGGRLRMQGNLLDAASKEEVAARVMGRLISTEPHRGKKHEVRSIIQMQARRAASALRGHSEYRPFVFPWW